MYSIDKNGKEHIIQFAPESWLISDRSSLYFNEKSIYYIEAVEDSEVLFLHPDFFNKLVEQFPNSIERSDFLLQKHIRSLQNRINSLLGETAEERYMSLSNVSGFIAESSTMDDRFLFGDYSGESEP
jgi:CRP-like cAMP-binding protein